MREKEAATRRDFLKLAAASAPAAAVAAVAPAGAQAAADETARAGLRETEHVRKYLETARF